MAVDKRRTGVDRGSPVNNRSRSSRENTGEIVSTPVSAREDGPRSGQQDPQEPPARADVHPSRARSEGPAQTLAEWVAAYRDDVRAWSPVSVEKHLADCLVDACDRPVWRVGLCRAHTWRAYRAHQAEAKNRLASETSGQSAPRSNTNRRRSNGQQ